MDQIARTRTEEVRLMSIPDSPNGRGSVKTLAIRLEPDSHAQLSLIAQLRGSTIADEIRTAIEAHIVAAKRAPDLAGKADSVLEDIERDASARRAAIATLFGASPSSAKHPLGDADSGAPLAGSRSRRKAGAEAVADS